MSPQICKSFTENVTSLCFALNSRWSTTSLWYRFTTIAPFVAQYFSKSLADVTTFSTVFLIGYVVVSPLSGWAFDRIGMRWSMIAGASCNLLGGWTCYGATWMADSQVKYTGKGSGQVAAGVRSAEIDELMINDICGAVEVMLTGQTIAACGQPFFLNVPTNPSSIALHPDQVFSTHASPRQLDWLPIRSSWIGCRHVSHPSPHANLHHHPINAPHHSYC
ncbi:hypothetical protein BC938DRAFT_479141 [Jimgerdemannia flammicorona]|uniref:Uncharacterized protein n=1 Tax=Jimgerdemannia flammicorona TaxID=994334 RepID=A0A433QLG1_9FUNG|nr:hypothetical protein BC938DRAFT_479141 [Jimgerdemannia flammicorona]